MTFAFRVSECINRGFLELLRAQRSHSSAPSAARCGHTTRHLPLRYREHEAGRDVQFLAKFSDVLGYRGIELLYAWSHLRLDRVRLANHSVVMYVALSSSAHHFRQRINAVKLVCQLRAASRRT